MKNFLTEKLLLDTKHGSNCTLEVCTAGEPDNDIFLMRGTAGDCLRKTMTHELAFTGDQYFCLYTNQGSFDGISFDDICWRMGYNPEEVREVLAQKPSLSAQIGSAAEKAGKTEQTCIERDKSSNRTR